MVYKLFNLSPTTKEIGLFHLAFGVFWLAFGTCLAQDNLYIKRSDLKPVIVTPKAPTTFTLKKGVQLQPVDLAIEQIDTTRDVIVTVTVVNVSPPPPPKPDKIIVEAESATSILRAQLNGDGKSICCIEPGAAIVYTNKNFNGQKKIKINVARANPGTGTITMRIGSTSHRIQVGPTGGWSTWQTFEIPLAEGISGDQPVQILSDELGPCNINWFEFE